jgi:hypothetical protein
MAAFLGSCSDEDNTTTPSEDNSSLYSFFEVGNSWTYQGSQINRITGDTTFNEGVYTLYCIDKAMLDGKDAFILKTSMTEDGDPVGFYADENGISINTGGDNNIHAEGWLKIINFDDLKWEIYNETIDKEEDGVTYKGFSISNGEWAGMRDVVYKGKTYKTYNYYQIDNYKLTTTYIDEEGKEVSEVDRFIDTTTYSIIPNIGIYSFQRDYQSQVEDELIPKTERSILVDHYVK